MYSLKSTAAFNSPVTKNNYYIFYTTSFHQLHLIKTECFPLFLLKWDKQFSIRENWTCALYTSEKKIKICRLQVVHSACIWKRHWSMLRVGRGKLTAQAPLHLFSPSYKLLIYHKICIQAFTWFHKKNMTSFGVTNSHLSTPILWCSSLKVLQCIPNMPPESGDFSSGRPFLLFHDSSRS